MSSKKYVYLFESSFNPNTDKGDVRKIVMDELDYNKALVHVTDEWKERLPEELFSKLKIRLISLIIIDSVVDIVNNARLISCCYNNDYGTGNGFKFANIDSISINDFLDNPCHFCINHYYIKSIEDISNKIEELIHSVRKHGWLNDNIKSLENILSYDKTMCLKFNEMGINCKTMDYNLGEIVYDKLMNDYVMKNNCMDIQDYIAKFVNVYNNKERS